MIPFPSSDARRTGSLCGASMPRLKYSQCHRVPHVILNDGVLRMIAVLVPLPDEGPRGLAIALSHSEFFERRGTSLSGSFVALDKLVEDVENKKIKEAWSDYIVREFLPRDVFSFTSSVALGV